MKMLLIVSAVIGLSIPCVLSGLDGYPQKSMEASVAYDYLTPDEDYADWKSAEAKFYVRINPLNTIMVGSGVSIRDETFGWVQAALYRDWATRFSTYTSFTGASETKWMGRIRADNDLYYKLGKKYQYILVAGQTAVFYENDKIDYILSVGGVLYYPHLILDGRYFFNRSDPGEVWSDSQKLSVGFGTRGKSWTTVTALAGEQKYTGLDNLGIVNKDVFGLSVSQEIWLTPNGGIKFGGGYLDVREGYEKYNVNLGWFCNLK